MTSNFYSLIEKGKIVFFYQTTLTFVCLNGFI
jgi:hypothetical protein